MGVTQREDIFQRNISWNIPEWKAMRFHIGRTKQLPNTINTKAPTTKPVTVNVQILVIGTWLIRSMQGLGQMLVRNMGSSPSFHGSKQHILEN